MTKCECLTVKITKHGHEQFCERVVEISYIELNGICQEQLNQREYTYRKNGFIHLSGVWWVYVIEGENIDFITCYGRTEMDMPKALGWAARQNDRINLENVVQV